MVVIIMNQCNDEIVIMCEIMKWNGESNNESNNIMKNNEKK
jgi:hypothetical protein